MISYSSFIPSADAAAVSTSVISIVHNRTWFKPRHGCAGEFVWDGVVSSSSCRKDGQTFSRQPRKMFPATSLKDFVSGAYSRSLPRASPFSQSVGKWSRASVP